MTPLRLILPPLVNLLLATPVAAAALHGPVVHVNAAMVTLGDVFSDVDTPEIEIAKAPPVGKTIAIDNATLSAIAVANHVDWQTAGLNGKLIVFRDTETPEITAATQSKIIPNAVNLAAAIEPLKIALQAQHVGNKLAITLDPGLQQHYLASLAEDAALTVESVDYAAPTGKFRVVMVDAVSGERQALTGRAVAILDIPVPTHEIRVGDIIKASDLADTEMPADKVRSDTAQNPDVLVGKVAKNSLSANVPVQERFVGYPIVIKRGDRVTMLIQAGPMTLTATGRALDDAGMGETVHLVNAASNHNLQGVVTGPGMAEVQTGSAQVASLNQTTIAR